MASTELHEKTESLSVSKALRPHRGGGPPVMADEPAGQDRRRRSVQAVQYHNTHFSASNTFAYDDRNIISVSAPESLSAMPRYLLDLRL